MPFIPLHDINPRILLQVPWVTYGLIAACVLMFFYESSLPPEAAQRLFIGLGVIPASLLGYAELPAELAMVSPSLTTITSLFLHGSVMHLAGNMLFLWVFGDNVEDAMGHGRFILFYGLCGIAAGLIHSISEPTSTIPVVGASGAISGVLGAYLLLFPKARVLIPIIIFPVYVPAALLLIIWFGFQALAIWGGAGADSGVAWWAHVGGFIVGAILVVPFRHKTVPIFGDEPPRGVRLLPRAQWRRKPAQQQKDKSKGPWS
ncbi:MAG: rhomboid family intramembrane serine protease [Kiloniellales bacterium]